MSKASQITQLIRALAGTEKSTPTFLMMEVVSIEEDTCTAKLDNFKIDDIKLSIITGGAQKGLLIIPAIGSTILVVDTSGEMRDFAVVGFTDLDKITIQGGTNGGMVMVNPLKSNLNALQNYIEQLQQLTVTALAPLAALDGGASVTAFRAAWKAIKSSFKQQEMENENIKH